MAHPVYLHLYRQVSGIHFAYPRTAQLHINEQVLGNAEGELSLLLRFNPRIDKITHPVGGINPQGCFSAFY